MNEPLHPRVGRLERRKGPWTRLGRAALEVACGGTDEELIEMGAEEPVFEAVESYAEPPVEQYGEPYDAEQYSEPYDTEQLGQQHDAEPYAEPYEAPFAGDPSGSDLSTELGAPFPSGQDPGTGGHLPVEDDVLPVSYGGGQGEAGGAISADAQGSALSPALPSDIAPQAPAEPWLSVGVGTLRNMNGLGNGSPIDSKALVRAMEDLGALGNGAAQRFDRSAFNGLLSRNPSAPFTGQGATGVSPLATTVPLSDLASMARYHQAEADLKSLEIRRQELRTASRTEQADLPPEMELRRQEVLEVAMRQNDGLRATSTRLITELEPTVREYRNALSDQPSRQDPRDHFDDVTREQQARLLLEQPITTLHKDEYGDRLPTRGEVILAAAQKYDLDPDVLAGVILHEQRDQSRREDSADILASTLARRDTSIGLGQILMSTATKDDASLLKDTVDEATRKGLSRDAIARLLTSDEHNIMATARYLRLVADKGVEVGAQPGSLPATRRAFPGLDTEAYRTSAWGQNPDNIKAIASEYTSKPWDDRVIPPRGYPTFVLTAVEDIRRANVFGRR